MKQVETTIALGTHLKIRSVLIPAIYACDMKFCKTKES